METNQPIKCECGHSFNFDEAVERKWKDGFQEVWVVCPNCKFRKFAARLSRKSLELRRIMIKKSTKYRTEPTKANKDRYQTAVKKYQTSFDHDNAPVTAA